MKTKMLFAVMMMTSSCLLAQNDTIRLSENRLKITSLQTGTRQYMVLIEDLSGKVRMNAVWSRTVNFVSRNGKDLIEINQLWKGPDSTNNRALYSLSDKKSFAPIYHYTKSSSSTAAFNFEKDRIALADSVDQNFDELYKSRMSKDFEMALTEPTLNWELDMEVFETLPFKEGKTFYINFYHPGSPNGPKYYAYKVEGVENLVMNNGEKIPCWKLRIQYREDSYATFWFNKKTNEFLKMEEFFKGGKRYKIKLVTPVQI